jgi:hypothetical protein
MATEAYRFLGYQRNQVHVVAVFGFLPGCDILFALGEKSLKERISNLRKKNSPTVEIQRAIRNWPTDKTKVPFSVCLTGDKDVLLIPE